MHVCAVKVCIDNRTMRSVLGTISDQSFWAVASMCCALLFGMTFHGVSDSNEGNVISANGMITTASTRFMMPRFLVIVSHLK